jgi:hypothetical protein
MRVVADRDGTERLGPEVAAAIVARFLSGMKPHLTTAEWSFLLERNPPVVRIDRSEDGDLALVIEYFGGRTSLGGWDGSLSEAQVILDEHAETAAANVSEGYWASGGWRTQTTFE